MRISKKLLAGLVVFSLIGAALAAMPLFAATPTATVSATVTPRVLSVTITAPVPPSIGYGAVNVPSTDNVPVTPTADQVITAKNDGNATEKLNIRGANATSSAVPPATSIAWTITTGTPGGAVTYYYNHKFGVPPYIAAFTPMDDTAYATLVASIAKDATQDFKLRLSTPTDAGGDFSEHSTTVTVQAAAP